MLNYLIVSQLLPQIFLGGSGLDLARMYVASSQRSVVASDRVVSAYGPVRFRKDNLGNLQLSDVILRIHHNPVKSEWKPPSGTPTEGLVIFPQVDSLYCTIYPPQLTGILPTDAGASFRERMSHQGTLKLAVFPKPTSLTGTGTDSVKNLSNQGLTKSLTFPSLMGDLWFSASLVNVSEIDFLTGIAQLSDCNLLVTQNSFVLEPNAEKIRSRFLNTLRLLGTDADDIEGVRTRIRYRAFELAPTGVIIDTVSKPKLFQEVDFPTDPEMIKLCERLKELALEKYVKSGRPEKREFKPGGKLRFAYGYSFSIGVLVEMSDGAFWMM